jgi:phage terminase large subunit-like protein
MVTRENYRKYKKTNPYHVWVHMSNGRKFVGHFKSRADTMDYQRRAKNGAIRIGAETTAARSRVRSEMRQQSTGFTVEGALHRMMGK